MDFREVLDERIYELKCMIEEKRAALAKAPEGYLRIHKRNGTAFYAQCLDGNDKIGKYIAKREENLIKRLAQKRYDQTVLRDAEKQLDKLVKLKKSLKDSYPEDIYRHLSESRRALIDPLELPFEEYAEKWRNEPFYKNESFPEDAIFTTERNEKVRSKSELIIAGLLDQYQIPYRYECCLSLMDRDVYPDFTVLNIRTRQKFCWEHLGKMDDAKYVYNNMIKLESYCKSGYFPGINLILTHETKERPLDTGRVKAVIKAYLL